MNDAVQQTAWRQFWRQRRQQSSELAEVLRRWPWFETLRTLRQRLREDHLALTASSLTFTTLISLVPLVTVMLALFTAFPMFGRFQAALQQYFLQSLVPDSIARPVLDSLTKFAGQANRMGSFGLILLGLTALALMFTIDRTLNAIWRVPKPRPLAHRVLVYWAAMTLGPLVLGASLWFSSYAVSASRGLVRALPFELGLLLNLSEFGLLALSVACLFRFVPNTHVRWTHAWSGALFVALGFELAKRALVWYDKAVPGYSVVYGAFATLPIFLLWIYLGWVIVLLGAVIAAYAPSLQMRVTTRELTPGWRFEFALAVLHCLRGAQRGPERGLSLIALGTQLRADPLQLEPVVELLAELDWVGVLDEGDTARHVLLCDPASTPLAPLIDRTLLNTVAAERAFGSRLQGATLAEALA